MAVQDTYILFTKMNHSDLDVLTTEELKSEIIKLRTAIMRHRDSSGHDLCWFHPELWNLLPEGPTKLPVVPETCEFLKNCAAYRASLDKTDFNAPIHKMDDHANQTLQNISENSPDANNND